PTGLTVFREGAPSLFLPVAPRPPARTPPGPSPVSPVASPPTPFLRASYHDLFHEPEAVESVGILDAINRTPLTNRTPAPRGTRRRGWWRAGGRGGRRRGSRRGRWPSAAPRACPRRRGRGGRGAAAGRRGSGCRRRS